MDTLMADGRVLVMTDDPNDAALVAWAVGLLARQLRVDGSALPASLRVPIQHVGRPGADRAGQERTIPAVPLVRSDDGDVTDEIVTYAGAGRLLGGVSERTVARLVTSGELPKVTVGRRRFVRRSDVEAYIERKGAA